MTDKKVLFMRHAQAIGFSVIVTTLLPLILYSLLFLISNEQSAAGSPLIFFLIPLVNFILSICLSLLLFLPLFSLLEWLLNKWRPVMRKIAKLAAIIFIGLGSFMIFVMFYGLLMNALGNQAFLLTDDEYFSASLVLFFSGIPILLGGSLYWLFLQPPKIVPKTQEY